MMRYKPKTRTTISIPVAAIEIAAAYFAGFAAYELRRELAIREMRVAQLVRQPYCAGRYYEENTPSRW